MEPIELIGERVKVREFTRADLDTIFDYAKDAEATRFLVWPAPLVPEDSLPFLSECIAAQSIEPRLKYELAVELNGKHIGGVGLRINPNLTSEAELGYVLHRDYWGQGLIPEASQLVINFAFQSLGVHRVVAFHDVDNEQSMRVMEKVGLQYEGRLRGHLKNRTGEWRDSALRSILVTD